MSSTFKLALALAGGLGVALLAAGLAAWDGDLSRLAALVGQAGSPNERLLEKIGLVPPLLIVTGSQLLFAAGVGFRYRRSRFLSTSLSLNAGQKLLVLLLAGSSLLAVLTFNFEVLSLAQRFSQQRHHGNIEIAAPGFDDEQRISQAVRSTTPDSAAILIKTNRPLQYLLNYELYPRRFYFYSDRSVPVGQIPPDWLNQRKIGWVLQVSDDGPLWFQLTPRKESF